MTEVDLIRLAWQVPVTLMAIALVALVCGGVLGYLQRRVRRKQEYEPPEAA